MLYLVRHGQTDANAAGLIQGQRDYDLTPLGLEQVAGLGAALPAPARVVSSPLRRARQTAAALAGDRLVEIDARWMELDYGEFEGRAVGDVRAELWENWSADAEWAPPGGESLASASRRVAGACDELAASMPLGEDVIVVTHVGPIKAALAWALDVTPKIAGRLHVALASITVIDFGDPHRQPVVRAFNLRAP